MGQSDVIEWLKNNSYRQEWFTTKEIRVGLNNCGFSSGICRDVRKKLVKLWIFNIAEFKGKHILDPNIKWKLR